MSKKNIKHNYLAQGLLFLAVLGYSSPVISAEIEILNEPETIHAVAVIIQLDEVPLPDENEPHPDENEQRPDEPPLISAPASVGEKIHAVFDIFGDVAAIAGSTVFISTQLVDNPILFPLSAGIAAGCGTIDFFRDVTPKLAVLKQAPGSFRGVGIMINGVGQIASNAGLILLAGGIKIETSAWLAVGGGLLKFGTACTELGVLGISKTFGNDNTVTNSIFRIGMLGVGGTIGGLLLASGISGGSSTLVSVGIYVLSTTGIVGTSEVLVRDIQALRLLGAQPQELNP